MNYYDPRLVDEMREHTNHITLEGDERDLYNRIWGTIPESEVIEFAKKSIPDEDKTTYQSIADEILVTAANPVTKKRVSKIGVANAYELASLFLITGDQGRRSFYAALESSRVSQRAVNQINEAIQEERKTILDDAKHDLTAIRLGLCEK